MTLQHGGASPRKHVIDTCEPVCTRRGQLVACAIEARVQHFVVMPSERLDALSAAYIPQFTGSVDRTCQAVISREVKLPAGKFALVAFKSEDALSGADVPNLCSIVKGGSHEFVAVGVEAQGDDFCGVTGEGEDLLARLHVPQLGGAVHGAGGNENGVGVELQADDLHCVALQRV